MSILSPMTKNTLVMLGCLQYESTKFKFKQNISLNILKEDEFKLTPKRWRKN